MPVALEREPISVDVYDAAAVRAWLKERVALEVKLKGQPHPKVLLLADGYQETLDLTTMSRDDPQASLGATFQLLRQRPNVERQFVLLRIDADQQGQAATFAMLFEEIAELDRPRRWWMSMLKFRSDPRTHIGQLLDDWRDSPFETERLEQLWPVLREIAQPPPGARPARVLPPRRAQPDIRVATHTLRDGVPAPTSPVQMAKLVVELTAGDLLTGRVQGSVVVRLAERVSEVWVLGDGMPTDLDEMMRTIANRRAPPAEGIGVAEIAILPQDDPPVPYLLVRAELGGSEVEALGKLAFSEPEQPPRLEGFRWSEPAPVPEEGKWLGVEPMVLFELGPLGVADA